MGEVDRAGDTKLGRDVAINVLPESLRADPDRYELNWPALLSKVTQR